MTMLRSLMVLAVAFSLAGSTAAAQATAPVSADDVTKLEATVSDIRSRVTTLRTQDPTLARELEKTLTEVSDEVTYLRVRLRREGSVPREDYTSVRDRLETLRIRAQGPQAAKPSASSSEARISVVPVGTEFDIRLQQPLNSGTATVEQRFEATTLLDYSDGGRVVIPAGSLVRGFVSSVSPAGRLERRGSLTLSFDELQLQTRSYRLRASVTQAIDGKMAQDVSRIGVGAAVGAIIGGIIGGTRGALVGVLVGGGGTIAATEGSNVDLPAGTILRIRLDQPLEIFVE